MTMTMINPYDLDAQLEEDDAARRAGFYVEDDGGHVADYTTIRAAELGALALSVQTGEIYRVYNAADALVSMVYRGAVWQPGELTSED